MRFVAVALLCVSSAQAAFTYPAFDVPVATTKDIAPEYIASILAKIPDNVKNIQPQNYTSYPFADDKVSCPSPDDWALTYDDGPTSNTALVRTALDKDKGTFFVVGSRIIQTASNAATLKTSYDANHQIALHTWSHPHLTTLSNEQIIAEIVWNARAVEETIGKSPAFLRLPCIWV
jgi:peptidoglycan/xylan/chitin deacetylase (PgdA/CDA1 family)